MSVRRPSASAVPSASHGHEPLDPQSLSYYLIRISSLPSRPAGHCDRHGHVLGWARGLNDLSSPPNRETRGSGKCMKVGPIGEQMLRFLGGEWSLSASPVKTSYKLQKLKLPEPKIRAFSATEAQRYPAHRGHSQDVCWVLGD